MAETDQNRRYRMPVVFGPTCGPRQGPDGGRYDYADAPRTTAAISFLTRRDALLDLMPPHCRPDDDPVVTVEHVELRALEWLAGRSYSLLSVKVPVVYEGPEEQVRGAFLPVLWENRAEPIISGREELGFAKLFCDLPPPRVLAGKREYSALWDGHGFIRMEFDDLAEGPPPGPPPPDFAGVLHHRYFPAVSREGVADVEQMVLTPAGGAAIRYDRIWRGQGRVTFVRSSWEQLPTMFHIVNRLAELPVVEWRGASIIESRGTKDLSDQRVLR
ncbi:acetoacetate decarboxylase family protein [Rhizorhabdus wittichii]